jgi:hypothetical protein
LIHTGHNLGYTVSWYVGRWQNDKDIKVEETDKGERKEREGTQSGAETIEGSPWALQSVDDIQSSHSLPLRVLSVGDRVTNDILKENLEDTSCLLVDETRDTLYTTTTRETTDSGLGDTLNVITKNFTVALSSALSETLRTREKRINIEQLGKNAWITWSSRLYKS